MIFVQGTMNMKPSCIPDFVTDVASMIDKVKAEDGCQFYSLLVEDEATGLVNVIEQWRDDDALHVHFAMPWIGAFFAKYSPKNHPCKNANADDSDDFRRCEMRPCAHWLNPAVHALFSYRHP